MDETNDIEQKLKRFPSSFDLIVQHVDIKAILKKISTDQDEDYDSEEYVYNYNLLSFLYWIMDDDEKAREYNRKAIESTTDTHSLISLSNKAYFYLKKGDFIESKTTLMELERLETSASNYSFLVDAARAEIAFSYSRLGAMYYDRSIDIFEEILHRNPGVILWKYKLGVVYRRLLHDSAGTQSKRETRDIIKPAYQCLEFVAKNAPDGTALKARAWLDLGNLARTLYYKPELKEIVSKCESGLDAEKFYEQALRNGPDNCHVLQSCGSYYRICKKFGKSEELLKKSIDIGPSSYSHHHLALTIKSRENHRLRCVTGKARIQQSTWYSDLRSSNMKRLLCNLKTISDIANQIEKSPGNPEFQKAIYHLETSIKLNERNTGARLELGVLYMALENYESALSVFEEISSKAYACCSVFHRVKNYEHQAFCLLEMSDHIKYREEEESLIHKARMSLYRAIESHAVATFDQRELSTAWKSVKSLKHLFMGDKIKEMEQLQSVVQNWAEVIDFHRQILELNYTPGNEMQEIKDYYKILQMYLQTSDFDNAVLLLKLWRCTELSTNTNREIRFPDLYVQVHMKGALHKLMSRDFPTAKKWFYDAFSFAHGTRDDEMKERGSNDVAIFSEPLPELEEVPKVITGYLKRFGLQVVRNEDERLNKQTGESGYVDTIKSSKFVILIIEKSEISDEFWFIIDRLLLWSHDNTHKLLVITVGECRVPRELAGISHLKYRTPRKGSELQTTDFTETQDDDPINDAKTADRDRDIDVDWLSGLLSNLVIPGGEQ